MNMDKIANNRRGFVEDDVAKVNELAGKLKKLCADEKIGYCEEKDEEFYVKTTRVQIWKVTMPRGARQRKVTIYGLDHLNFFVKAFTPQPLDDKSAPSEKIRLGKCEFLADYNALINHEDNSIEAAITELDLPAYTPPQLSRRLKEVVFVSDVEHETIQIGPMSDALAALVHGPVNRLKGWEEPAPRDSSLRHHSIKLGKANSMDYQTAIDVLEKVSNHLFLEIDRISNLALTLDKESESYPTASLFAPFIMLPGRWQLTSGKCDNAPMEFYRHARRIGNMPLIKFLLNYQAVEYYYPNYPGPERNQLRAVLNRCSIGANTIRTYLTGKGDTTINHGLKRDDDLSTERAKHCSKYYEERQNFFNEAKNTNPLKAEPLNAQNPSDAELMTALVERIYGLRCRIVHTKDSDLTGQDKYIMPTSPEAKLLGRDIDLMRFIAQQVLSQFDKTEPSSTV